MAFNESNNSCLRDYEGLLARTEIGDPDYKGFFIAIAVINAMLSLPTILGNSLVILAIYITPALQSPSYILLSSLALTDLIVGLIVNPIQVVMAMADLSGSTELVCGLILPNRQMAVTLGVVSFFSLVAISVDRYLAIYLKLQYRTRVTVFRVRLVVIILWLFAITIGFLSTKKEASILIFPAAALFASFLVLLVVCYCKSFRALRVYCVQVSHRQKYDDSSTELQGGINVKGYREVLTTMAWLFTFIIACYIPMLCMMVVIAFIELKADISAWFSLALTAMYVNSCINPIVYVVRIKEIREACFLLLTKMSFFCDKNRSVVEPINKPSLVSDRIF